MGDCGRLTEETLRVQQAIIACSDERSLERDQTHAQVGNGPSTVDGVDHRLEQPVVSSLVSASTHRASLISCEALQKFALLVLQKQPLCVGFHDAKGR